MNSIAHEITGDRIIGPMIDLSACAKTDRTLIVGSKALELMLEMQRRGSTIPSAWVYWKQGWSAPWPVLAGVIIGLLAGTDLGARLANRIDRSALHFTMIFFVSAMALYMAYKALS